MAGLDGLESKFTSRETSLMDCVYCYVGICQTHLAHEDSYFEDETSNCEVEENDDD